MTHQESQTAILVAAEALLRAVDYPACRGLPAVTVPTTLLGQLAGAVASVVDGVGDAALLAEADYVMPPGRRVGRIVSGRYEPVDRPGLCQGDPDCFRVADLPSGTCHHHSEHAKKLHPWQAAQLRAGVFAVGDADE